MFATIQKLDHDRESLRQSDRSSFHTMIKHWRRSLESDIRFAKGFNVDMLTMTLCLVRPLAHLEPSLSSGVLFVL